MICTCGMGDHASTHEVGCAQAVERDRDRLRQEFTAVIAVVQKRQPGGSPPPGGPQILAEWAFSDLERQLTEAKASRDRAFEAANVDLEKRRKAEFQLEASELALRAAGGAARDFKARAEAAERQLEKTLSAPPPKEEPSGPDN